MVQVLPSPTQLPFATGPNAIAEIVDIIGKAETKRRQINLNNKVMNIIAAGGSPEQITQDIAQAVVDQGPDFDPGVAGFFQRIASPFAQQPGAELAGALTKQQLTGRKTTEKLSQSDKDRRAEFKEVRKDMETEIKRLTTGTTLPAGFETEEDVAAAIKKLKREKVGLRNRLRRGGDVNPRIFDREGNVIGFRSIDTGESIITNPAATEVRGGNLRADKTEKGPGFFGEIALPDGRVSTEFSIGVRIKGKETEIPTLVPTLTQQELDLMINDIIPNGKETPDSIVQKAVDHANQRISEGKSPFAQEGEQQTAPGGVSEGTQRRAGESIEDFLKRTGK